MSNFISHEPCPKCGSRDNLGIYDDGHQFCFGCKYYKPGEERKYSKSVVKRLNAQAPDWQLPSDFSDILGDPAVAWLHKYDLDPFVAHKYMFGWSSSRQRLICRLHMGGRYVGYQARNFEVGPKYLTRYNPEYKDKHVYYLPYADTPALVLVEDIISAIKVHLAGYNVIALMGSFLKPHIRDFILNLGRHMYVFPWLDPDKTLEGNKIKNEMELYGYKSDHIVSSQDPKDYSISKIQETVDLCISWIHDELYRDAGESRDD